MSRKSLFLFVALFYTLYLLFPLFSDLLTIPVWLPSIVSSLAMFMLYPKAFQNKVFYWFLVYAAVLTLFLMIGKPLTIGIGKLGDNKKILIEFAYILPTLSIFSTMFYLRDNKLIKEYVKWSTIILYLSFFVTLPLMNQYNSLREAYFNQDEIFSVPGLPSYSLMHAYTLFVPVECYALKVVEGRKTLLNLILLLFLCYVIIHTYVTTSLIIMIGILLFTMTYSDHRTMAYWLFVFFLIVIVIFLYKMNVFIQLIDLVAPFFDGTAVAPKLEDIRKSMMEGEIQGGSITGRQNLHDVSWNSFFENPLWGTSVVGGHSSLLDRFAGMGIIGGLPFLMIIITFYNLYKNRFIRKETRDYFFIGIIAGFILLYEKGNWGAESWLMMFVLLPFALLVIENNNQSYVKKIS